MPNMVGCMSGSTINPYPLGRLSILVNVPFEIQPAAGEKQSVQLKSRILVDFRRP